MYKINNINKSIVALVTPMQKKTQQIDYGKFKELINWHIEQGTNGLVIAGSTGESATLEEQEWIKLLETAKEIIENTNNTNKLTIIAGTGTNYTNSTIKKTVLAENIGIDAALVVTPYYNKPTQQGLFLHYSELASKTKLPIILYNVPSRTGCDLLPNTVIKLTQIPNIIGIKEATGKLERVTELKIACREDFILLSGDDASFIEFMLLGGVGIISVTANIFPAIMSKICQLILNKQANYIDMAKKINSQLHLLHKLLMIESNPIPVKWLLAHLGKIDEVYRLPLTKLSQEHHACLIEAYQKVIKNIDFKIIEECNL